jgi:hypothetical protein
MVKLKIIHSNRPNYIIFFTIAFIRGVQ